MLNGFEARPPGRDIYYLHRDRDPLRQGDWVLLRDAAGDAFWVEVQATDRDPPHAHCEGVLRGLDSPLGIATRPLVHLGLEVGDRVQFEPGQVVACAAEKPGFATLNFHRHHLGPAEKMRL